MKKRLPSELVDVFCLLDADCAAAFATAAASAAAGDELLDEELIDEGDV